MIGSSSYLLDTNAISETRQKQRDARFEAFFQTLQPPLLYLSVLTLGELRKGVDYRRKKDPVAGAVLGKWVDQVEQQFDGRILDVDLVTARLWGELSSDRSRPAVDTLLAATAIRHDLTIVTRNVRDFHDLPVRWINPWTT